MEDRIIKLEEFAADTRERLSRIEARLDDFAEKIAELRVEIQRSANETIRWVVGTAVGLGVAAITIITFVLNNATPKSPPAPMAPITIYAQPIQPQQPTPAKP